MFYPMSLFRSFGVVLIAFIIVVHLRDDLKPKGVGICQAEAFKVIEFFNRVFNKNPDQDMTIIDVEEDSTDSDRLQDRPEAMTNGITRQRSSGVNEISILPWRIFDFGYHQSIHHQQEGKASIVKRHAMYSGKAKKATLGDSDKERQLERNDLDDDVKKSQKSHSYKDKAKRNEFEKSKPQDRRKMERKSDNRDDKPTGKWRKLPARARDEDGTYKKSKSKSNKNIKASRRGGEENEEETEEVEDQGVTETIIKQKQTRKRKPWMWSRRYKASDDEQVEENTFQKRLNKRIGDIESWKRMIYCKFNYNAPECAKNETSPNSIDFFGKFKKFTKRPKNKSSTTASNNATSPASTTGFTEGSTTEFTRATTSSFDEGRFATNGTTVPIPTRGDGSATTTQPPTTVPGQATTDSGSTTQPPVTDGQPSTTPGSTTPGSTTQGSTTPGSTTPGSTTPGSTTPGSTTPGSTTPGSTTPGSTTPGSTTPGSTTPGSTTPGSTTPGSTTPGSTTPGSTTPGSTTPGSTTPGSTTPGSTTQPITTQPPLIDPATVRGLPNPPVQNLTPQNIAAPNNIPVTLLP